MMVVMIGREEEGVYIYSERGSIDGERGNIDGERCGLPNAILQLLFFNPQKSQLVLCQLSTSLTNVLDLPFSFWKSSLVRPVLM